ncbi:hypothetical protein CAOG_05892 [Capsaspora owczarzaki ATCC 30864]|uniref:Uncharacterized protein n=1 Tax=Capsaspora owczarzaki (strain ATCC 30864) TaxID=595528 RepID=A0A0D2VVE2_CAPO3|nr:hypothetical protein CAOG_05892 [Capsaspora owczarzaki ATCC 30864]KJE95442.1 hypothetical protein CAOG_005892 [Capsaspora owczarzaki ATCC 30864]|eukprot:XP_004345482.1 hypothetical protein CAOG_05892 [Capsaspora owczarzaki ATCC 30864]
MPNTIGDVPDWKPCHTPRWVKDIQSADDLHELTKDVQADFQSRLEPYVRSEKRFQALATVLKNCSECIVQRASEGLIKNCDRAEQVSTQLFHWAEVLLANDFTREGKATKDRMFNTIFREWQSVLVTLAPADQQVVAPFKETLNALLQVKISAGNFGQIFLHVSGSNDLYNLTGDQDPMLSLITNTDVRSQIFYKLGGEKAPPFSEGVSQTPPSNQVPEALRNFFRSLHLQDDVERSIPPCQLEYDAILRVLKKTVALWNMDKAFGLKEREFRTAVEAGAILTVHFLSRIFVCSASGVETKVLIE